MSPRTNRLDRRRPRGLPARRGRRRADAATTPPAPPGRRRRRDPRPTHLAPAARGHASVAPVAPALAPGRPARPRPRAAFPAPAPAVAALPAPVDMVFAPTPAIASNGALVAPLVPPGEHDLRPWWRRRARCPTTPTGRAARWAALRRHPRGESSRPLRNGPVGRLRNYGNTSVNIRVDFPGPIDGSFKPSERLHEDHWRAEIAAFRLNQLLGLERVPPAVFRRVPEELPNGARYGLHFDAGMAHGAMIYWVPVFAALGGRVARVVHLPGRRGWAGRRCATTSASARRRCRRSSPSTSSSSTGIGGTAQHPPGRPRPPVYRDNNAGFQVPVRSTRFARVEGWLHGVQRFSRRLIAAVRPSPTTRDP